MKVQVLNVIDNEENDNVDVHVHMPDGNVLTATFFTKANVQDFIRRDGFFYCVDAIIVDRLSPEIIEEVVQQLNSSGELETAMGKG
ncbi:MAG: hypothetical protein JJ975_12705 [Bacteroidia bacterium]|nr:hypothetical protein [Bacteroidia bacterium]